MTSVPADTLRRWDFKLKPYKSWSKRRFYNELHVRKVLKLRYAGYAIAGKTKLD